MFHLDTQSLELQICDRKSLRTSTAIVVNEFVLNYTQDNLVCYRI